MKHTVIGAFIILTLSGCGPALPEALQNPSNAEQLEQSISDHCSDVSSDDCESQMEEAYCRHQGGRWVEFTNGCRDFCRPQIERGAGFQATCTTDMPMGCECGRDRCWDGTQCVDVPPPQGPLEVNTNPPAECFEPWTSSEESTTEELSERITQSEQCLLTWIDEQSTELESMEHLAAAGIRQCILNARTMAVAHTRSAREGLAEGEDTRLRQIRRESWEGLRSELTRCGSYSF